MVKKVTATPAKARPSQPIGFSLPEKKKEIDKNILHYTMLIYGREKIGKTVTFSQWPDAIFFSTEPGSKGLEIFDFNSEDGGVKNWEIFRAGVDLLEKSDRFSSVVIDTVDRAYDMCLDWVCKTRGIEYPGEDRAGKNDYGKAWRAVKQEFSRQIDRLTRTGRGVCFTSHAKEQSFKSRSGQEYDKIFPTMSNQARSVVESLVDMFFYAEYVRDRKTGETLRVLICQGDETIWAGARPALVKSFPLYIPLKQEGGFELIRDAFEGKYTGLDPASIMVSKNSSGAGAKFVDKKRMEIQRGEK